MIEEDTDVEDDDTSAWDKLTFRDKAKLVNEWTLIIIVANIIHIIGTIMLMMNVKTIKKNGAILVGFATFFIWTAIMRYFVDKRGYSIIQNTIRQSGMVVIRAIIGILPFFIGFGLLGTCIFWETNRFGSFSKAAYANFALM